MIEFEQLTIKEILALHKHLEIKFPETYKDYSSSLYLVLMKLLNELEDKRAYIKDLNSSLRRLNDTVNDMNEIIGKIE